MRRKGIKTMFVDKGDMGEFGDTDPSLKKEVLLRSNAKFHNLIKKHHPDKAPPDKTVDEVVIETIREIKKTSKAITNYLTYVNSSYVSPTQNAKRIAHSVAMKYGLGFRDVSGACRAHHIIAARWEALDAVRNNYPAWSWPKISRLFNKDHSTVLSAFRKIRILKSEGNWPLKKYYVDRTPKQDDNFK